MSGPGFIVSRTIFISKPHHRIFLDLKITFTYRNYTIATRSSNEAAFKAYRGITGYIDSTIQSFISNLTQFYHINTTKCCTLEGLRRRLMNAPRYFAYFLSPLTDTF